MTFIYEELIEATTTQVTEWWLNQTTTLEDKMQYIDRCTSCVAKGVATQLPSTELKLILDKAGTLCSLADNAILAASDDPAIEFTEAMDRSMKVRQSFCDKFYKEISEHHKSKVESENAASKRIAAVQSTKIPENKAAEQAIRAGNFAKYSGPGCAVAYVGDKLAIHNPFDWLRAIFITAENYQDEPTNFLKRVSETVLSRDLQFLVNKYVSSWTSEELMDKFLKDASPFMRIQMISAHLSVTPVANTLVEHYLLNYIAAARPHWSRGKTTDDETWTTVPALKLYALQVIKICITGAVTEDLMDLAADWTTPLQTIAKQLASHSFGPIPFAVLKQIVHQPFQFVSRSTAGTEQPQTKRRDAPQSQGNKKVDNGDLDQTPEHTREVKRFKKWDNRRGGGDSYKPRADENQARVLAVTVSQRNHPVVQRAEPRHRQRMPVCVFCNTLRKRKPHCEHALHDCRQLAEYTRMGNQLAAPLMYMRLRPTVFDSVLGALKKPEHTLNELSRFIKINRKNEPKVFNAIETALDLLVALNETATAVYADGLNVEMFLRVILASLIENSTDLLACFKNKGSADAKLYALRVHQLPFVDTGLVPICAENDCAESDELICAGGVLKDGTPTPPNIPAWLRQSGRDGEAAYPIPPAKLMPLSCDGLMESDEIVEPLLSELKEKSGLGNGMLERLSYPPSHDIIDQTSFTDIQNINLAQVLSLLNKKTVRSTGPVPDLTSARPVSIFLNSECMKVCASQLNITNLSLEESSITSAHNPATKSNGELIVVPDCRLASHRRHDVEMWVMPLRHAQRSSAYKLNIKHSVQSDNTKLETADAVAGEPCLLSCRIDSGSDICVMPMNEALPFIDYIVKVNNNPVMGIGGTSMCVGILDLLVCFNGRASICRFNVHEVTGGNLPVLLGSNIFPALGIQLLDLPPVRQITKINEVEVDDKVYLIPEDSPAVVDKIPDRVQELIKRNTNIPPEHACTHPLSTVEVKIPIDHKPIYCTPNYPSKAAEPVVTEQVGKWLQEGVIERCNPASQWNCRLVVTIKTNSNGEITGKRVCIDPRHINKLTPDEPHPLPLIFDHLEDACGGKVFASIDLKQSFHQFKVHPRSKKYLTFTWNGVQYQFCRGPFGLKALAAQFQRVMSAIFADLDFVRVFIDDIVVSSNSVDEHTEHLVQVLDRLNHFKLRIGLPKSYFYRSTVSYLGHVIEAGRIRPHPSKIRDVDDFPEPETGKQMQSFLGLVNYLRHFIPLMSTVSAPLDKLRLRSKIDLDDPEIWTHACADAFAQLKHAVRKAAPLYAPDFDNKFYVATDASNVGIGAVLFQGSREQPKYITMASRALSASEKNYSATKRELRAIIFALDKFHFYLAGRKFLLYTDHKALTAIFSQTKLTPMLETWLDKLLAVQFDVEYIPGILNVLPDCLSRLYPGYKSLEDKPKDLSTEKAPQKLLYAPYRSTLESEGGEVIESLEDDDSCGTTDTPRILWNQANETNAYAMAEMGGVNAEPERWDVALTQRCFEGLTINSLEEAEHTIHALAAMAIEPSELKMNWTDPPQTRETKVAVPEINRRALLEYAHTQGHYSGVSLRHRLMHEGHYWPNMLKDCRDFVQECIDCQRYSVKTQGFHPPQMIEAALPMDHLAIDCASLDHTNGYTHILLIIDICTRFAWLYPMRGITGINVAEKLFDVVCMFGIPKIIQSDNGPEFVNRTIQLLTGKLGIESRRITAYNPQANGAAERLVRTVRKSVMAAIKGVTERWPEKVKCVQYFYNTAVHSRHGSTPFSLMFARAHVPPAMSTWPMPLKTASRAQLAEIATLMAEVVWPASHMRSKDASKRAYNQFVKAHQILKEDFPDGAQVMRRVVKPRSANMDPKYEGPYTVLRRTTGGAYLLKDATGATVAQKAPAHDLRLVSLDGVLCDDSFVIDKIIQHEKNPDGSIWYKIKWINMPVEDATWVREEDINTREITTSYWKSLEDIKETAAKKGAAFLKKKAAAEKRVLKSAMKTSKPGKRKAETTVMFQLPPKETIIAPEPRPAEDTQVLPRLKFRIRLPQEPSSQA